jgi:hypothetical protein
VILKIVNLDKLAEAITRILDARRARGGRVLMDDIVAEVEAEIAPEFPPEMEAAGRGALRAGVREMVRRVVEGDEATDPADIAVHIAEIERHIADQWPNVARSDRARDD